MCARNKSKRGAKEAFLLRKLDSFEDPFWQTRARGWKWPHLTRFPKRKKPSANNANPKWQQKARPRILPFPSSMYAVHILFCKQQKGKLEFLMAFPYKIKIAKGEIILDSLVSLFDFFGEISARGKFEFEESSWESCWAKRMTRKNFYEQWNQEYFFPVKKIPIFSSTFWGFLNMTDAFIGTEANLIMIAPFLSTSFANLRVVEIFSAW